MPVSENSEAVCRLTQEAYDQLLCVAREEPDVYFDPRVDFREILGRRGVSQVAEETGVVADPYVELVPAESGPPNRADAQAHHFYRSLKGVTPAIATDERMWAWLTHFRYHSYSRRRWRMTKTTNKINYILSHWFVRKRPEGLWLYNTAARTWWIAHIAAKAAKGSGGGVHSRGGAQRLCEICSTLPYLDDEV